jgi:murein DD-endopeptidase MepM/ murein hydrolase activator NlpD
VKKYPVLIAALMLSGCLTPTGKQQPAEVLTYGQTGGAGTTGMHTVNPGDTVYTISQRYNLPLREIISINSLNAPYPLTTGMRVKLPPPNEYKVRPGDTLNGISRMFSVSVSEVAKLNNIASPFVIEKGQVVRLPSAQPKLQETFADNPPLPSFDSDIAAGEKTAMAVKPGAVESEVLAPPMGQQAGSTVTTATTGAATKITTATPDASGKFPPQPTAKATQVQKTSASLPQVAQKVPARAGSGRFMRPVDGKVISKYGPKDGGLHNDGINIKAARGTAVRAAENGVVAYAGNELQGYGNLVLIRHADRYMTAYAHMEKIIVKKGETVKVGQSIGTVGSTGQVDSPQLHFEVRRGTQALNPDLYL